MKEQKDFSTPADIFAEHGTRKHGRDCAYVNLRLAVVNLIRTVNELEDKSLPFRHCKLDDKPSPKPKSPAERLVPGKYVVNKKNDFSRHRRTK